MILAEIQEMLQALADGKKITVLMDDDDEYIIDKTTSVSVKTLQLAKAWHVVVPKPHAGYMAWFKANNCFTKIFLKKEDAEQAARDSRYYRWETPIIVECRWEEEE